MTEEELSELRAYKPAEVARLLNMPVTRLETWVREDRVPHQRAGVTRAVEFSAEDIRWIGRMRPHLMGGRRGGHQVPGTSQGPSIPNEMLTSGEARPQSGGQEPPPVPVGLVDRGAALRAAVNVNTDRSTGAAPGRPISAITSSARSYGYGGSAR